MFLPPHGARAETASAPPLTESRLREFGYNS